MGRMGASPGLGTAKVHRKEPAGLAPYSDQKLTGPCVDLRARVLGRPLPP